MEHLFIFELDALSTFTYNVVLLYLALCDVSVAGLYRVSL